MTKRLLKAANALLQPPQAMAQQQVERQRQQAGMRQMATLQPPPSPPLAAASPGVPQSPTGGFGAGGYQGAANALGPPVTRGKLGNGPGVNMMAGGQTAGGVKVGSLTEDANALLGKS